MRSLLLFVGLFLLAGCGQDAKSPVSPTQPEGPAVADSTRVAVFADTNLEATVREALKKPAGPPTQQDLLSLTQLVARDRGIVDLRGIEQLDSLTTLDLTDNRIVDLAPLSTLTRLVFVDLTGNQVEDITPLAPLKQLQFLILTLNKIHDLSVLLSLPVLQNVELSPLEDSSQVVCLATLRERGVQVTVMTPSVAEPVDSPQPVILNADIAYMSDLDGNTEIYVIGPDRPIPVNLTRNPGNDVYPVWSPDGCRIAFGTDRDGNDEIYLMNADGSGLVDLTSNPGSDWYPTWSPDGNRIAFYSSRRGGSGLYVMNADGSDPSLLVKDWVGAFPSWSPDGNWIAYVKPTTIKIEGVVTQILTIGLLAADGLSERMLTLDMSAGFSRPSWSPDGMRIAFGASPERDSPNAEIYVMNADGSNPVNLTRHPAFDDAPCWSPDGRQLAFSSRREERFDLYLMDADGSNVVNLTSSPAASEWYPAWAPR